VDCKINFLVDELCYFDMSIAGISEWFGQGVQEVDGFVIVHFERPLATGNDAVLRNERVGVCHLLHYQNQCSCSCFVISVTGDLRIWLDTDVIAFRLRCTAGSSNIVFVCSICNLTFRRCRICQGTIVITFKGW